MCTSTATHALSTERHGPCRRSQTNQLVAPTLLSRVLFLSVLSSLIIAGALVSIQAGLTARHRRSELAKLRQLLAA
jgi:hypothetical protein